MHSRHCLEIFGIILVIVLHSGSHIENWHSILRNGLVVASNTKLQVSNLFERKLMYVYSYFKINS